MEPIDNIDTSINYNDYMAQEYISDMYKKIQDTMDIPSYIDDKEEIKPPEFTTDKSMEELKILVGEIFAMGVQIGKERARFGSQEAYDEWCKNKPQADIQNMLLEVIKKINKLYESNDKSITKTPVKKTEPLKKKDWKPKPNKPYEIIWDTPTEEEKKRQEEIQKYADYIKSAGKYKL